MDRLERILRNIDGRNYRDYRQIRGDYRFTGFDLVVDHVQGDPYAAPSRLRVLVHRDWAKLPAFAERSAARRRAARDWLARRFRGASRQERDLSIDAGAQTVLDRSACLLEPDFIEIRFRMDLPGAGRRILGRQAWRLLGDALPRIVGEVFDLDLESLEEHIATVEDQVALRRQLADSGLVAFVADSSLLPRRSGIDDRPLADAVPFVAPESLRVTLTTPNSGPISGLGISRGITLIVGGGFHGKSTLLRALEQGVYDHIPGDGRELAVCDPSAVKIRAEDGRAVSCVDISAFIGELPGERGTSAFTTELASGSTSQAASLVEALEAGSRTLLIDEDTSATNFMIRDRRMQALVGKESEPITPLVDRIRELRDRLQVSVILVMGGSGDYLDQADAVLQMHDYESLDVTGPAGEVAARYPTGRVEELAMPLEAPEPRRLSPDSLDPESKPGRVKIQARGRRQLVFGRSEIELDAVEQIVDPSQVRTIGWLLAHLSRLPDNLRDPRPHLADWLKRLEDGDWSFLSDHPDGDLALPRIAEVLASLSRLREARFSKN